MAVNCMKCGKELKNGGVFCEECLADMEKYPVKSNISVHLPYRPTPAPVRKKKQKYIKPEDQIRHLKKVRNWLVTLLIVALLAFTATAVMLLHILDVNADDFGIGQNYGTIETNEST